jgi:hypothetical protein
MQLTLGPIDIRFFSGKGWSSAEVALVTARKGGQAQRETCVRGSFKSEHLTEVFGEEDPTDMFLAPDGQSYYGRVTPGLDGDSHIITAQQVYARKQRADAIRAGLKNAEAVANSINSSNGVKQPVTAA